MGLFAGTVVYLLIWWLALFIVLPIGTNPEDAKAEDGGWRGAPANPRLGRKLIGTTVLATILWLGVWGVIESGWISFRDGWWAYAGPETSTALPGIRNEGGAQN